ncbi:ABC transporter permease [Hymenobacter setariae]|uniref:ABC transporter permease n=1 Tax=Hymenobacter setariae TaxID=2594794 RepID=A0A558C405_9BACT|nr:ABC transporter permease [Hymenobacter setariae]TVT43523.1 ABC transporter permease [Hymenobacter setariae]
MKETIYTPYSPLQAPRAFGREILHDLRLVHHIGWQLFRRNLRVQIRQNLLGYFWMLLPPILTGLTWTYLGKNHIIQGYDATAGPYPAYVLAGLFIWQGFVEALNCPLQQLQSARGTIAKVKVPHEAFIVAGMGMVLFNQAIRMLILAAVLVWFHIPWHASLLLVPVGLGLLLVLGLALGWLLTPVSLLYADISSAVSMALGFWFLITPIVYTPPKAAAWLTVLNPVTPLLTTTRNWVLTGEMAPAAGFGLVAVMAVGLLGASWLVYRLARPHLIARL